MTMDSWVAITVIAGFGLTILTTIRQSARGLESRLSEQIVQVEARLGERISQVEARLGERISQVEAKLGPPRLEISGRAVRPAGATVTTD